MFSTIYRVFGGLMILTVLTFNAACFDKFGVAKGTTPRVNTNDIPFNKKGEKHEEKKGGDVEKKNNQMPYSNEGNGQGNDENYTEETPDNVPANENVDESSVLVGVWRTSYVFQGMQCYAEIIFQNNGQYASLAQCQNGAYAIHLVGNWYILQQGAVRIQYTDYSPKEYGGNPIRIPDGETVYFRVINSNRVESSLGMLYRAQ